jgi:uridine kinase
MTQRSTVLRTVADQLGGIALPHPVRVGIDGVCGAGKSTLARELRDVLEQRGRAVVLVDSDGFHHVRERRYRQGRDSARGYYEDSYDFDALVDRVLRPLGPGGDRRYAVRVHDLRTDETFGDATAVAEPAAIVLFDATFLQRDGLREQWDVVIFVHADEQVAIARGVARDAEALGGPDNARAAYDDRYMAACRIYLDEQDPRARASIVLDNSDPGRPFLERGLGSVP